MSNHTHYIWNDNEEKYQELKDPNATVNMLLASYFSGDIQLTNSSTMSSAGGVKQVNTFAVSQPTASSSAMPSCPNGHLLSINGKCLTKGCKYSK